MKQAYRILFLMLTVVFSFGFTNSESTCTKNTTTNHSCCQKSEEKTPVKKCKGTCCVQSTVISRIEIGLAADNKKQEVSVSLVKKSNNHHLASNWSTLVKYAACVIVQAQQPVLKISKHTPIKTQSWLI